MRRRLFTSATAFCATLLVSCASDGPLGPSSAAITQLVEALRARGLTVTVGEEIAPSNNGFFSVSARQIQINTARINAFEYATENRAAAEARQITHDADPSPTVHPLWVSRPQFYHRGALIVLYAGCKPDVLEALEATLGAPVATGTAVPCRGDF